MDHYRYETHKMADPLLPFIFHPRFVVTRRGILPNWHENLELLYCTGGEGYVQCGPEQTPFRPGDIFVVNADMLHSVASETTVVYRCLIIDSAFCAANGIPVGQLRFRSHIRDTELADSFAGISAAFAEYDAKSLCAAARIRYEVLGLMLVLCEKYLEKESGGGSSSANAHVKKAMVYIRRNLSAPLSLDVLAAHVGVSKYHLSREFKAFTGSSIIQTVNLIRCTEAKRLMEGGLRVSAAAEACGFENLSYFTRIYKKHMGCLPSTVTGGAGWREASAGP